MQTVRNLPNGLVGIYLLKNKATDTIYVGATTDIRKRVLAHLNDLLNDRHGNSSMQEEFNKYGDTTFSFKIVLRCEKDVLHTYEQIILDRYRRYYKVFNKGLSVLKPMSGAKRPDAKVEYLHKHREESREAFRNYVKTHPEYVKNLKAIGRKQLKRIHNNPELEAKRKERAKLACQTEEVREKKRKAMLEKVASGWRPGKPNPINKKQVIYIPTGEIFDCITSACKHCGCAIATMSRHLNGVKNSNKCKGYFFYHPNKTTYDVLNVGDKNRFFVRSSSNPDNVLCVHNCGYSMSADTFRHRMELAGNYDAAHMADKLVAIYRSSNSYISAFWQTCDNVLKQMIAGKKGRFGGVNKDVFEFNGNRIKLPNDTYLCYHNLRYTDNGRSIAFDTVKDGKWITKRIFAGAFTENLVQALAFAILKAQALDIYNAGIPIHLNVHDEWVSVVKREELERTCYIHYKAMSRMPKPFYPSIPNNLLACEVSIGKNYADLYSLNL